MSTHVKPAPRPESLLGAWHAQVAVTAKHSPWLVRELLQRRQELLPKFTAYYRQLRALPRRTRRLLQRKFAPSLAGAALLFALGQGHAIAATINVGGGCSLIDAITAANTDAATGGCTAGSGADTINLPAGSTHTLTTVNNSTYGDTGLPVISSAITIDGNGSTIKRDPVAVAFRLIAIKGSGDLTLQNTTLNGGIALGAGFPFGHGGGIVNSFGQLRLEGCTVSGNTASTNGGGIFSRTDGSDMFSVVNSTLSGNSTTFGGGVDSRTYGSDTFSLVNSTLSGNTASTHGGGMYIVTSGSSTVTLQRSLVAGNSAAGSGDEVRFLNFGGSFLVDDFNLFGHSGVSTADALSGATGGASDLLATSDSLTPTALTDILDTTLADNGGPTPTHALVSGSPAIDASPADADCQATDQRGVARPQGTACDIGAFEFAPEICGNCIDDDGDGKIDLADDDCQSANPLAVAKGKLTLKPDPNKDQILLNANFSSAGVVLDPPIDGVAVSFFDADGSIECLAIPPNSAGWKVNKKGTTWSFKDAKDDSLGDPEADEKVIIKRNDKKGRYEITVNIKEAELIDPDAGLISSGIVIGDELRVNTQPWESAAKGKKLVTP